MDKSTIIGKGTFHRPFSCHYSPESPGITPNHRESLRITGNHPESPGFTIYVVRRTPGQRRVTQLVAPKL